MSIPTRPDASRPREDRTSLPRLEVAVRDAEVDRAAATPSIALRLRVCGPPGVPIRAALLGAQVRIDPRRRGYDDADRERLRELFGPPSLWSESLQSLLWARLVASVPPFTGETEVVLALPCTYDFEIAASKLLHGLRDGAIPLALLFNGNVFYTDPDGALRTVMLPWDVETRFDLPVALWREAIDRFFPGSAWLRVDRDLFDRLHAYRSRRALPSWEATLGALLDAREEESP